LEFFMACSSILVVEDDEDIAWILRELLASEGYDVVVASNGKQALELLPKMQAPCLVLLDLMMPVMNGWEFLRAKVQDARIAPLPVVVVTAYDDQSAAQDDVKQIIRKPIEMDTLLKVVREYCQTESGNPGKA